MAVVAWQQAEQQLRQFHYRRVGGVEKHVVVRQLFKLFAGGSGQVLAPIAEVGAPQARHTVQVAFAVVVPKRQAFTAHDHPWAFLVQGFLVEKRMNVVRGIQGLVITGAAIGFHLSGHCESPCGFLSVEVPSTDARGSGLNNGLRMTHLIHSTAMIDTTSRTRPA
ncbi:hypothetical protein D3C81_616950 [compost metagenome]